MRELEENNLQKMAQKFQVLSEILEGCFFYICLNFSHRLIVRAVCIDNRSMVITEDIFALFLKLFAPGICSRRFTASSYQRPLESFLIVHRTLAFC